MAGQNAQPTQDEVLTALRSVLTSPGFADAGRLGSFLKFVVDQTLAGNGPKLKESVIGVEVFGRPADYDPRIDPIVRVEARRLRSRLEEYYKNSNYRDSVRILIPKGSYVPSFESIRSRNRVSKARVLGLLALAAILTIAGLLAWFGPKTTFVDNTGPVRVAVLPFTNVSADPANEYFSDGLTEELINALARVQGIQVVARSVVFQFKANSVDVRRLSKDLGVSGVVEGSVRQSGDRLRITAQLVSAENGYQLWSQTYDRRLSDLFAIQEEIAASVVENLKVQLKLPPGQSLAPRYTTNVQAYNLYLKGRHQANLFSTAGVLRALAYFDSAHTLDPAFAPAYAAESAAYTWLEYYQVPGTDEWWRKAKASAEKALAIDQNLSEAHAALGFVLGFREWKWGEAERALRRAIELNPASADAHALLGSAVLLPTGRVEEANRELARALELDPLSVFANFVRAYSLMTSGRLEEAIAQYRRTLELKSIHPDMYWDYGMALGMAGRHKEAEEAIRKSKEASGEPTGSFGPLELWLSGRRDEARAALPAFEKRARDGRHSLMDAARTFSMMGETEKGLEWLRRAVDSRESQAFWIRVDPRFRSLHSDPRYQELVRRLGLDSRP